MSARLIPERTIIGDYVIRVEFDCGSIRFLRISTGLYADSGVHGIFSFIGNGTRFDTLDETIRVMTTVGVTAWKFRP